MVSFRLDMDQMKKNVDDNNATITAVALSVEDSSEKHIGAHSVVDRSEPSSGEHSINVEGDASSSHTQESDSRQYDNVLKIGGKDGVSVPFQKGGKRPNKGSNGYGQIDTSTAMKSKPTRTGGTEDSELLTAGPQTFQVQITNVNSALD